MHRRAFLTMAFSSISLAAFFGIKKFRADTKSSMLDEIEAFNSSIRTREQEEIVEDSSQTALAVSEAIQSAANSLHQGQTTSEINSLLMEALSHRDLLPTMLGYRGFPAESAISVSPNFIHAPPSDQPINDGDLVTIQFSGSSQSSHASQGWTCPVGAVSEEREELLRACREGLRDAISVVRAGAMTGAISSAIQQSIDNHALHAVRDFAGYTMGQERIQRPNILSYWRGDSSGGDLLESNTMLNIHVMAKTGSNGIRIAADNWTAYTTNSDLGALVTAMVLVTPDRGIELTKMIET